MSGKKTKDGPDPFPAVTTWARAKARMEMAAFEAKQSIENDYGASLDELRDLAISEMKKSDKRMINVPTDPVRAMLGSLAGKGDSLVVILNTGEKPDTTKRGISEAIGKTAADHLWAKLPQKDTTTLSLQRVETTNDALFQDDEN